MKQIYLDYAAATPIDEEVLKAMEPFFARQFYNPSAVYLAARSARQALEQARCRVACTLGAKPPEIIFTAGATEANNLAIAGVMNNYPNGEVLVSSIEHESVLAPAGLFKTRQIPVNKQGLVDLLALQEMLTAKTVLVSVMMINNEIGTIQPLREIAKILDKSSKSRKTDGWPLYLHTDAAQAPNHLDMSLSRLGVDMLSLNAGKIYGPKQSGALYIRAGIKLAPLILGGGQENGLRSGTENLAAAAGLAKALEIAQQKREAQIQRLKKLRQLFINELGLQVPSASINGSSKHASPHIVSVTFAGADNERLMMELDERGIQTATGSACSASSDEPSYVLAAIGLTAKEVLSTLRFSFGRGTTEEDIRKTVKCLKELTGR